MLGKVPDELKALDRWVLWRGEQKIPFQAKAPNKPAKSTDQTTWATFDQAVFGFDRERDRGLGFVFVADDVICGVDLDKCRDVETGKADAWAKDVMRKFDTYTEVSPSGTGFKLYLRGSSPWNTGKKLKVPGHPESAIEVYEHSRYFAVTGERCGGVSPNLEVRQASLDWLKERFDPPFLNDDPAVVDSPSGDRVLDRARKYVEKMPEAISGQSGHNATFRVACALAIDFDLPESDVMTVLREYNQRCQPPWTDRELLHKAKDAAKQPGVRGLLKNATEHQWPKIERTLPTRQAPPPPKSVCSTLSAAVSERIERIRQGQVRMVTTGIPDLDDAIGGGVEYGEIVTMAARPSHGKTMMALQALHHQTRDGNPTAIVSLDMSRGLIAKRVMQFASTVRDVDDRDELEQAATETNDFLADRAVCYLVERCHTLIDLRARLDILVHEEGVRFVVLDYIQRMSGEGRGRYEMLTNISSGLRDLVTELEIVLVLLCQMNRAIEDRKKFIPMLSDIRDTGAIEQDSDVVLFPVWPHKFEPTRSQEDYLIYVAKNRNRETKRRIVECCFDAPRQKLFYVPDTEEADW